MILTAWLALTAAHAQDLEPVEVPGMTFPWAHQPEISRRGGPWGGVLVLSPRVIGTTTAEADAGLQLVRQRLETIASRASPTDVPFQARPEPERTCQKDGCRATTLGALVATVQGGCAVVAVVGTPGTGPVHLVPWAGAVTLSTSTLPFRVGPEQAVAVDDFVPCLDLAGRLDDARVEAGLRDVLAGRAPSQVDGPLVKPTPTPAPTPMPTIQPDDDDSPWG